VTNNGSIVVSQDSGLQLNVNGVFNGTGSLTLEGGDASIGAFNNPALINGSGHTIQGSGTIGLNPGEPGSDPVLQFTNPGVVTANSGFLTLSSLGSMVNDGTMQAVAGSTLTLHSVATMNNAGGAIVANGGVINFGDGGGDNRMAVQGGSATVSNGGSLLLFGDTTNVDITLNGGSVAAITGMLKDNITINSGSLQLREFNLGFVGAGGTIQNHGGTIIVQNGILGGTITNDPGA